jgi:glutamyl-tRNA reductase
LRLALLGLNHKTAPVDLREAMAVTADEIPGVLRSLIAHESVEEAMWLSTCNRVEIYVVPSNDDVSLEQLESFIIETRQLATTTFRDHGYRKSGNDAVSHLFRVSASLDSMVLGEPQILGQVKQSIQFARRAETMGPILSKLTALSLQGAKRIRSQTGIGKMPVSVGSVAVDLAKRIFGSLNDCRVLLVGAGKMGEVTARALSNAGTARVYVTNRSAERARRVADEYGWSARKFDELEDLLGRVDVVLTSTAATSPIIDAKMIRRVIRARKFRPLFILDIAVPRDVDPTVSDMDTIYLYNVDDLVAISDENQEARLAEVTAADRLLQSSLADVETYFHSLAVQPTVTAIRTRTEATARAEIEKSFSKKLKHLSDGDRVLVEQAMTAALAKVLHPTMVALNYGAQQRGASGLVAAARLLYGLESQTEKQSSDTESEPSVDGES